MNEETRNEIVRRRRHAFRLHQGHARFAQELRLLLRRRASQQIHDALHLRHRQ